MTQVRRYPNGVTEDTNQRADYYYDTNPFDAQFSQYVNGRLAAVQYTGGLYTFKEMFLCIRR